MKFVNNTSLALLILFFPPFLYANSLCMKGENQIISGKVGVIKGNNFTGNKILSLCAPEQQPPFSKLIYRFGLEGKIELEYIAPENGEMFLTSEAINPKASLDIIYFSRGQTTYGISRCGGGNCARSDSIELRVFNGKKMVAKFLSVPKSFNLKVIIGEIKGAGIKEKETNISFAD